MTSTRTAPNRGAHTRKKTPHINKGVHNFHLENATSPQRHHTSALHAKVALTLILDMLLVARQCVTIVTAFGADSNRGSYLFFLLELLVIHISVDNLENCQYAVQ
jgi:uncharacterized membrane protein HdeD (DUF308 family)